ncbi:MAG: phytanoyl-CoA dioxygenase family protein [Proteobacteria bacterium]|nr:phytanoyl-CoA dioxygenase family protein [Pseudomonadota bacterium]
MTADSAALPVPPFRGTSLPDIDYASHPAYGGTFQPSTARERLQALVTFLRSFAFVTFRRIVDYDNMPLLSKEVGGGRLTPAIAARYMVIFPRLRIGRILRSLLGQRRAAVPANRALCDRLFSDGIACLRLSEEEIEAVRRVTAPGFAKLDRRRMEISLEKRKFDDNVYWCTRSADPQAFEAIERIFRRHGITDAASAYLGRPVGVKHINPQINEENYAFWKRLFADTKVPDPWTSYLHVDATYGMLKGAIYIHDIGPDNGPFCYVRASHRAKVGGFEGLIRRTNDFCGFSGRRPEARRKFMALPRVLRKKADFGGDVLDSSPDATCLKEGHLAVTSDYGNCVVFDGKGIHRGGMVNKGERRCVFIVLAEI